MSWKTEARIITGGQWFELVTPYDEDFLDEFRSIVPADSRRWEQLEKIWRVSADYLAQVKALCEAYFEEVYEE